MNPFLFTLIFLLMMSFLTSSEAIHYAQSVLEKNCYAQAQQCMKTTEALRELSHIEELRGEESDVPPPPPPPDGIKKNRTSKTKEAKKASSVRVPRLNINTARPPNNSRLNIFSVFHESNENLPGGFSFYEAFAALMRHLYAKQEFFVQEPNVEYLILNNLLKHKERALDFTTPDELATLTLDDAKTQEIFYKMLKGTRHSPSLLHYVTFDTIINKSQARKINLLFADPHVLRATFPSLSSAEKFLRARQLIWSEIIKQEESGSDQPKGRMAFREMIDTALMEALSSEGFDYKNYKTHVFDYTLGDPGTVIFVEDPLTHELIREKYEPPKKKKVHDF